MDDFWRVVTEYPLSPLIPVFGLWAGAVVGHARGRHGRALALAMAGVLTLWICSTPAMAAALEKVLVARQPPLPVESVPVVDAIVLLGGALASPRPPDHRFLITPSTDRVWHAAELFRAGRAPLLVVSAGPEPPESDYPAEAHTIADMLVAKGVPRSSILLETRSRNTRENATFSLQLIQSIKARRVLLVTSPRHMGRALETFNMLWPADAPEIVASSPRPSLTGGYGRAEMWFPTGSALLDVTKCLKEFAGLAVLYIMGIVTISS